MKRILLVATLAVTVLVIGCGQPQTVDDDADNGRQMIDSLMTAYEEAWEQGDASAFDAVAAPGFTRTVNTGQSYGIDSVKAIATGGGIQDVSIDLGETIYGDDNAAVSWTFSGTIGGQSFSTAGVSFVTFEDERIAREHAYFDPTPIDAAAMQAGQGGTAPSDTTSMP